MRLSGNVYMVATDAGFKDALKYVSKAKYLNANHRHANSPQFPGVVKFEFRDEIVVRWYSLPEYTAHLEKRLAKLKDFTESVGGE